MRSCGFLAVELIAATSGLGFVIIQAGDYLNTSLVFAGIIMIVILGLAWTRACAGCCSSPPQPPRLSPASHESRHTRQPGLAFD